MLIKMQKSKIKNQNYLPAAGGRAKFKILDFTLSFCILHFDI